MSTNPETQFGLPALPEPIHTYEAHGGERIPAFSANQMREYARAALLAADAQAGGEAVAWAMTNKSGVVRFTEDKDARDELISYGWTAEPLFAHPQPQSVAQGWMPIETAPKDGTMFLCWVKAERYSSPDGECSSYAHDTSQMDFCWWRDGLDGNGYFDPACGQIGDSQDVILWAPLPAVPGCASPAAPAAAHDDAALEALGWQRISCPVCGADGARAAPQPAAQVAQPLTEDQKRAMWHGAHGTHSSWGAYEWYAQGIEDGEAAHGIGKDQG